MTPEMGVDFEGAELHQRLPREVLLALDGLEQRLEISLAETAAAFALDDFVEQRGAVFHRLGEDLQHVAFVVAIHQDAELLQARRWARRSCRCALPGRRSRCRARAETRRPASRSVATVSMMLSVAMAMCCTPGPLIELQILFDLRFALALGRLVDRKLHALVAVRHHLRHQRRIFRADVVVVEVLVHAEAHHVAIEIHPAVHLAPADVAHHVVDILQAHGARHRDRRRRPPRSPAGRRRGNCAARRSCGWCRRKRRSTEMRTSPCSSCSVSGSRTLRAPRSVVSRQADSASSTHSAMSWTPSPCSRM